LKKILSFFPERSFRSSLTIGLTLVILNVSAGVQAQTVEDRITALMNQMTTAEKILQLHQEGGMNTADNQRLGIPGFLMADGPHGIREGMATSFPVGIGMASMWDTAMARQIGFAMGQEFRGKGKHQALGPAMDIDRDPRNGRSPETGGEDPYLCAQTTTAVVRGIQSTPIIATVKHYTANHRENGRTNNDIFATDRVLNEDAGLAFRTAVQTGGALCVMNAYNLINGEKCAENTNLQTTILKTRWGFPYYVVSDWGAIWNSQKAINSGCDVCMGSANYQNDLPGLVSSGAVSMEVLDQAVRRVLRTKFLAGMMDYQPSGNPDDVNSAQHQEICREAGRKSLVLLKNEGGLLPLSTSLSKGIALIGPHAGALVVDGSGSAYVTPYYTVSPKSGIEKIIGTDKVKYAKGCDINTADTSGFIAAAQLAEAADVVVYCGGLDGSQEGEGFDRVGGSTALPGKQQDLINRLAAVNPNIVAVIFSGGICSLERCIGKLKGLVYAFYPGQEGGTAVGEVLFGLTNPGGKLPVTMPRNDSQLPVWNDDLTDDYGCGYRWYDNTGRVPQFAFGFGLSYTTFAYSNLTVTPSSVAPGEPVTVTADVSNTGSRNGDEVAQLYVSWSGTSVSMPVKALKGFQRVSIDAGQTRSVALTLTADELYYFNETTGNYDVPTGQVQVRVGGSSDNLPLLGTFAVAGTGKPDLLITNIRTVPPYPIVGQRVVFLAAVKNQGAAPSPVAPVKVTFSVNGVQTAVAVDSLKSIPVGGMTLVCSDSIIGIPPTWTAAEVGNFAITAQVDPENTMDECVESNNGIASGVTVYPVPVPNLALRKNVSVTSIEGTGYEGKNAVDGNMSTRWSSAFSDPQMLIVDLGATTYVEDVVLCWEAAYAKEYYVRIADGAGSWNEVVHITAGDGGLDRIPVGAYGSRIMMQGIQRATPYGYSLYEVEVHGGIATGINAAAGLQPIEFGLRQNFPNPFNPTTTVGYFVGGVVAPSGSEGAATNVRLVVYDLLGREVAVLVDEPKAAGEYNVSFDGSGLSSGVYVYRLAQAGHVVSRKMVLLR
jgi:beta-glucosidase